MTSRPGRIKRIVEVPSDWRQSVDDDVRSLPEFGRLRHEVWTLLREEVLKAQQQERRHKLGTPSLVPEAVIHG